MQRPAWPAERVERFKELLAESLSASLIADRLAAEFGIAISRNAVIGKAHRLGLPLPGTGFHKTRHPPNRRKHIGAKKPMPPPAVSALSVAPAPCSFLELTSERCRWPLDDPVTLYCGAPRLQRGSYCEHHTAIGTSSRRSIGIKLRGGANGSWR